ncbi:unnamed protein product, partial [Mesorhabditis belari]|uniref:Uncharacterized protein n=1 Tax=Mesorhabditis belari TaxID=2138241 RepID=A0AAF3J4F9_9BILA
MIKTPIVPMDNVGLFERVIVPKRRERAKKLFGDEFIGEVLRTQTTVDVEWMDGTISYDLPGNMLVPSEQNVINIQVVLERCALVRWLQIADDGVPADKGEEQCTLFEIMPHPLYQRMMIGAIGVEIGKEAQKLSDVVFQVKSNLKNGQSEVEYYNGTRATLWPTEMTLLFVPEDDHATQSSDEETDGDESWNNWSIWRRTLKQDKLNNTLLAREAVLSKSTTCDLSPGIL